MIETAVIRLESRARHLQIALENSNAANIGTAREDLRQSLVELYRMGYWGDRADQLKRYMRLFRMCRCLDRPLNARPTTTEPDRTARCNP